MTFLFRNRYSSFQIFPHVKSWRFLTKEEEQAVVNAIAMAEKQTSGEIRVHIEKQLPLMLLSVP